MGCSPSNSVDIAATPNQEESNSIKEDENENENDVNTLDTQKSSQEWRNSVKPKPPAVPQNNTSHPQPDIPSKYKEHKTLDIDDKVLERFLIVQEEISKLSAEGIFEQLQKLEADFEKLLKEKKQSDMNYRVLLEQSNKEKMDYDNINSEEVREYFLTKEDHEKAVTKEKCEFLESVKKAEAAKEHLKITESEFDESLNKYNLYQNENFEALTLFNEQMNILYSIFNGQDGSKLEAELESKMKDIDENCEIFKSALNKWSNSKFLLVYAYNQLQCSESRWQDLIQMDIKSPEKTIPATEVRNNLKAAYENILATREYLKVVEFPYLSTDSELLSLKNLSESSYKDMLTTGKQEKTLKTIQHFLKKCLKLNMWFDQVIQNSLAVEYSKSLEDFDIISRNLREERIKILQIKIKERFNKDVDVNLFDVVPKKNLIQNDTVLEKVYSNSNVINQKINGQKDESGSENRPNSTYEMPPPPSKEQILGDIEEIKAKYKEQTEGWNKHLDESRRDADYRLQKLLAQHSK